MQLRLATIKALTVCKIVEVKVSGILALLDQYSDACQNFREIAEKRFKELAPEPLEEHPFFKGFSKSFLNTLRTKCNSQVFFTGETIIKQGDAADSMIIISPASVVTIFVDDRKLKDLSGGCTLGALVPPVETVERKGFWKGRCFCLVLDYPIIFSMDTVDANFRNCSAERINDFNVPIS